MIPLGEGRTEEKMSSKTIVLFPKVKLNFHALQEIIIIIEWICSLFTFHVVFLIYILKSFMPCLVLKFCRILESQLDSKHPEDIFFVVLFSITRSVWLLSGRSFNRHL